MRPKIIIAAIGIGVVLIGGLIVVKGLLENGQAQQEPPVDVASVEPANSVPALTNVQVNPVAITNDPAAQQTQLEKDLDAVRENLATGARDPMSLVALLQLLGNQAQEVRFAAAEALMGLNDTNALPGLVAAMNVAPDAAEKAKMLEVIEYLKLPETGVDASSLPEIVQPQELRPAPTNRLGQPVNVTPKKRSPWTYPRNPQPGTAKPVRRPGVAPAGQGQVNPVPATPVPVPQSPQPEPVPATPPQDGSQQP